MENIFEKAFNRERSTNWKRGGRKLTGLSKFLKGNGSKYLLTYAQAEQYYLQKQYKKALELITKVISQSDIDDWKHYAFKANVLEDLGDFKNAISDYEKAIDINLQDENVYALYHQIGFCYLSLGNNQKAKEFYSFSLDLKKQHPNTPSNPDQEGMNGGVMLGVPYKRIYNNRGNAYKNLGELKLALTDCEKALQYDQNYSNCYLLISQIFSQAGKETEAIKYLKTAAQLGNRNAISTLQQIGQY